jgi:hypothetical protein
VVWNFKARLEGLHTLVCQLLYIQYSDLDALLGKQVHNGLADAIAASGHNDDLLVPIICVLAPVVRYGSVKPRAQAANHAEPNDVPQMLERGGVFRGEDITTGGVAPEQEERERERWVEYRELEQPSDGVGGNAYGCGQSHAPLMRIQHGVAELYRRRTFTRKTPFASSRHYEGCRWL